MPEGWRLWLRWDRAVQAAGAGRFPSDEETLVADGGRYVALIRVVGRQGES